MKSSKDWLGFKSSSDWGEVLTINPSIGKKEEEDPLVKSRGKTTGYCLDYRDEK